MKKFCLFLLIFLFTSCSFITTDKKDTELSVVDTLIITKHDTVFVIDTIKIDSLAKCLKLAQDSFIFYRDSVKYKDYTNARRIEKIKYYISICEKNTKNKQFFFGWIKRTMTE